MQTEFYKKYLRSEQWQQKKAERLAIDDYCCVMCHRPEGRCKNGLICHHINYRRLGNENVYEDLVSLCPACHLKIHAYYKRVRAATS